MAQKVYLISAGWHYEHSEPIKAAKTEEAANMYILKNFKKECQQSLYVPTNTWYDYVLVTEVEMLEDE